MLYITPFVHYPIVPISTLCRGYLAPEFGSREITYRLDIYSLGVIILEILTGMKGYEDVENVRTLYVTF
jgi:serine/threonine protein kinase